MRRTIRTTAAALCAAALALSMAGCNLPAAQTTAAVPEETIVPVNVQSPVYGDLAVKNEFIGRVMPDQSVSVYAKMGGEVLAAPFEVGDTVRAGDLLLQVDGKAVYAQVNQAKAAYDAAKVSAETQLGTGYDGEIIRLEASLNSALAQYDQAARAVKDYEEENGKTYGDDGTYRRLRAAKSSTADAYYAAQAALDLAKNGAYDDAVKASDAGLAQAEAAYKAVATNLDNLRVTAPISGVIEAKNFDVHDMASSQSPAYVISNKDVMTVTFNVPAGAVPAMTLGDSILIDSNGTEYTGLIVEVGSIASEQSGLFPIKARIEGDISGLLSGISVKVTASAKKAEGVLLAPASSISYENGSPFVYVVSPDNTAVKTPVETGISDDTLIEIVSGLSPSSRVVSTWSPDLTDGAKLSVTEVAAATPAQSTADSAASSQAGDDTATDAQSEAQVPTAQAPAASQAPAKPQATPAQAAPAQSASSDAATPAKDRESLVGKAAEADPPEPIVPDEIQAGDDLGEE